MTTDETDSNLIVALVILVIGGLLASALSKIVRGATTEAGLGNPGLPAPLARQPDGPLAT